MQQLHAAAACGLSVFILLQLQPCCLPPPTGIHLYSTSTLLQWFAAHLEQSAIVKKTITHLWYSCGKPQCTLEFVPYMDMAYGCYTVVIIYYAHT